jgi:DNA-binding NarL/FixJ family response regulator
MNGAAHAQPEPDDADRAAAHPRRTEASGTGARPVAAGRKSNGGPGRPGSDLIRVLVVDDHATLAGALAIAIDGGAGMQCVGTAVSIEGALAAMTALEPDVVLLDVLLPDGNGIDAIPQLMAARPGTRILVLTGHTDVDSLARAAAGGASGFLPKESSIDAVIRAIRAASQGQILLDGTTLASILGRLAQSSRQAMDTAAQVPQLSRRQYDVLALMSQGLDPRAISVELGVSLNTSRGYLKALMRKLGAHSQLEVIVISTRMGLLPAPTGSPRKTD